MTRAAARALPPRLTVAEARQIIRRARAQLVIAPRDPSNPGDAA